MTSLGHPLFTASASDSEALPGVVLQHDEHVNIAEPLHLFKMHKPALGSGKVDHMLPYPERLVPMELGATINRIVTLEMCAERFAGESMVTCSCRLFYEACRFELWNAPHCKSSTFYY